jgi:hypothetical protein
VKISRNLAQDSGSTIFEFVFFGLVLQITALTFFLQVIRAESDQLAAEAIARHALRSFVLLNTDPEITAAQIARDFEVADIPHISLLCDPDCIGDGSVLKMSVLVNSAKATSMLIR